MYTYLNSIFNKFYGFTPYPASFFILDSTNSRIREESTIIFCDFNFSFYFFKKLDIIREFLNEQENFDPYLIFLKIDNDKKGYLTMNDLKQFLASNFILFSNQEIILLFFYLDENKDGKITFCE